MGTRKYTVIGDGKTVIFHSNDFGDSNRAAMRYVTGAVPKAKAEVRTRQGRKTVIVARYTTGPAGRAVNALSPRKTYPQHDWKTEKQPTLRIGDRVRWSRKFIKDAAARGHRKWAKDSAGMVGTVDSDVVRPAMQRGHQWAPEVTVIWDAAPGRPGHERSRADITRLEKVFGGTARAWFGRKGAKRLSSPTDRAATFRVGKTYDVVTPESAEDGDVADRGWTFHETTMTLREVMREIEQLGSVEPDSSPMPMTGTRLSLYEVDAEMDYRTGATTSHCLHIKGSEGAMRRLRQILKSEGIARSPRRGRRIARRRGGSVFTKLARGFVRVVRDRKAP